MDYYVYGLFDNQGVPFYIGKGFGNRFKSHLIKSHNEFVNRKIAKLHSQGIEPYAEKVCVCDSEEEALDYEAYLIQQFGLRKHGGTLCNIREEGALVAKTNDKPIFYDGFIFPSLRCCSRSTGKSYDWLRWMKDNDVVVDINSDLYHEITKDYKVYENIVHGYYSRKKTTAKEVFYKDKVYKSFNDLALYLNTSKGHVCNMVRRREALVVGSDDYEYFMEHRDRYDEHLMFVRSLERKHNPVIVKGIEYKSMGVAQRELNLKRHDVMEKLYDVFNSEFNFKER